MTEIEKTITENAPSAECAVRILEAAVAWEVCASIHKTYAKGKDALFTTRQADFIKHANDARMKAGWRGLTDEEIQDCFQNRGSDKLKTRKIIAAAIEAKLREKNTSSL